MLVVNNITVGQLRANDLSLRNGEIAALTGMSGAGKTIFMKALADLIPHIGIFHLNGLSPNEYLPYEWRSLVMFTPAQSVWWLDTVKHHIIEHPNVLKWLDTLNLPEQILMSDPSTLSTGQAQRLSLLRVLTREPELLLLDEPTANLDKENVRAIEKCILECKNQNKKVIFTSHSAKQITGLSDQIWEIQDGQLQEAKS